MISVSHGQKLASNFRVFQHPTWQSYHRFARYILRISEYFSIALLKLPYRVKFSGNIQAAKLPNDCRPMNSGNIAAIAIGAGRYTVQNSEINSKYKLRRIQVTTMPTNACLPVLHYPNANEKFICANVTNKQSIYKGDSGTLHVLLFLPTRSCVFSVQRLL